jgi:hypothetical protein
MIPSPLEGEGKGEGVKSRCSSNPLYVTLQLKKMLAP